MNYVWDPTKAASNLRKHRIRFADSVGVFEDEFTRWQEDTASHGEERFVAVGQDFLGRVLTVVFTYRGDDIRLISAREATRRERLQYEEGL